MRREGERMRGLQRLRVAAALLAGLVVSACQREPAAGAPPPTAGAVDARRLAAADAEPGQWFTPGRDRAGSYHSPLADINATNVAQLGFAWEYPLGTRRGLEATPVVVDGVLYAPGNFGRVYALDAASGREQWVYDPQVDGQWGRYACCDAVNRGLAVWQGRVYVGSLDGYLHAIDAATGRRIWKVDTLPQRGPTHPYTVTGAPVIAGDAIIVGAGGGDFAGVRGYVAAYDLVSGALRWRFYTVPRNPNEGPQDQPHLEPALATWDPRHRWEAGGGATVWDGISYDPELGLLYVGTGNGAPYNIKEGGRHGGDDLYTASIVAIKAATGELAWYYQTTPGDRWDYDSTQKMILADLDLGRGPRKVLLQAAKNGYFYVLDRTTGELLAAHTFAFANWTLGLDPSTHRPRPNPRAEYASEPRLIFPGMAGAHSWQPMSFDPRSRLVFIPTIEQPMIELDSARRPAGLVEGYFTVPAIPPEAYDPAALRNLYGPLPTLEALGKGIAAPAITRGVLRALDPVSGRIAWEQPSATGWDGGVLSTDGSLVFQGDARGQLNVYAADSGRLLVRVDLGTSVMAAPMSYRAGSTQYVAVLAGYGGGNLGLAFPPETAAYRYGNAGRIIALKLGGGPVPHPAPLGELPFAQPPPRAGSAALIVRGEVLYNRYCARCHVFGRSVLPDLRRMAPATHDAFYGIVLNGAYVGKGMARWDDVLSRADAEAIHAYIVDAAWSAYSASSAAVLAPRAP
jgi:quinohemoprotein ethanol dehydrogenase